MTTILAALAGAVVAGILAYWFGSKKAVADGEARVGILVEEGAAKENLAAERSHPPRRRRIAAGQEHRGEAEEKPPPRRRHS